MIAFQDSCYRDDNHMNRCNDNIDPNVMVNELDSMMPTKCLWKLTIKSLKDDNFKTHFKKQKIKPKKWLIYLCTVHCSVGIDIGSFVSPAHNRLHRSPSIDRKHVEVE